jgi:hypothetical protein
MISWDAATRALLGKRREPNDPEERGPRTKPTLPRVAFLERPLPSSFSDPIPPPTPPKRKRARAKT